MSATVHRWEDGGVFLTVTVEITDAQGADAHWTDAADLGYLLHKHPDRVQSFDLSVGRAHVFYPEVAKQRCTAALLLEVDPIGLVRNKRFGGGDAFALAQYVNDRPYAASSMMAVALGSVFRTAMSGRCEARPELAAGPAPLTIHVPSLPCRGGADLAFEYFAPLGWQVQADPIPLDLTVPAWGDARYVDLRLTGSVRLADALNHLYVLLPVLDDTKHYWVSTDEIDKLLRAGAGWLATHPAQGQIMARYLAHQRRYVADATERLAAVDDLAATAPAEEDTTSAAELPVVAGSTPGADPHAIGGADLDAEAAAVPLVRQRADAVLSALQDVGATSVADLGCGEGALLRRLMADRRYTRIVGTDVSVRELDRAETRLRLHEASDAERERLRLIQSSLTYADDRLVGFDAAVLMEVIEHIDPERLGALERAVFGAAHPRHVIVTTPNVEYNVLYPALTGGPRRSGGDVDGAGTGSFRHPDHRFEWTRAQFQDWASSVASSYGYEVRFVEVGTVAEGLGGPTQLAVFSVQAPEVAA